MPESFNKRLLDEHVNKHYNYLLGVAGKITQREVNRKDRKFNLLHEVFSQIYEKVDRSNEFLKDDISFKKYVTKYLSQFHTFMMYKRYNKKKDNALFTFIPHQDDVVEGANEHFGSIEIADKSEELIYIQAENTNDFTKLFLTDMYLNDIPLDKGMMVERIRNIGKTLEGSERQIFELYYMQEITCLDIYNELKRNNTSSPSYSTILQIQKTVKKKIIEQLKW